MENTESNKLDRNLIGVLFPGIVKNSDKALQCLGGIRSLSHVYSQPTKKRLGLSYQPENPYVRKIFADSKKAAGLVLKIKVKKTKIDNEVKKEVISTTVVGRVKIMYKFESMCEFQYLPVHQEKPGVGEHRCLLDKILPSGIDSYQFMMEPAPVFIIPANFTRFDKPINYTYTDKRQSEKKDVSTDKEEVLHYKIRSDRGIPITPYVFNLTDELPTEPHEFYIKQKNSKLAVCPQLEQEYETIKKLFEERPIWSQNLIKYHIKIKSAPLKLLLPCLALYMKDGPWKAMWVRYGFDPRKETEARKYQILDFRVRHTAGVHSMVTTRDQMYHYKKCDRVRHVKRKRSDEPLSTNTEDVSEGAVYFRPGLIPTQRQIFYQYCDVKLPEVEELLATEPPPGYLCHQKRGWLPPNTDQICRDHIFRYVKQTVLATHNSDFKFEQGGSSDDEPNTDDEIACITPNDNEVEDS